MAMTGDLSDDSSDVNLGAEMSSHALCGAPTDDDVEIQHTETGSKQEDGSINRQSSAVDNSSLDGKNKAHEKTVLPSFVEKDTSHQTRSKEVLVNTDDSGQIGSNSCGATGTSYTEISPDMQVSSEYIQSESCPEISPAMQTSPEVQNESSQKIFPVLQASAEVQSFSTDEVDGDLSFRHLVSNVIVTDEYRTTASRPRAHTNHRLSVQASPSLTVSSNNDILGELKEVWKNLIVTVNLFVNGNFITGTASLLSWKIWTDFKNHLLVKTLRLSQKPHTAWLMVRVQNEFAALLEMADSAVVEFNIEQETFHVSPWHRIASPTEGSSSLVCEAVPIRVCEHLEKSFRLMCTLMGQLQQDPALDNIFFIIGHCSAVPEKIVREVPIRNDFHEIEVSHQDCLTLDESASHFLSRRMKVGVQDCPEILNQICPGDRSVFVISFGGDLTKLKKRYTKYLE